ncbi:MAG: response regulator [Fibrobacteria bacterium]
MNKQQIYEILKESVRELAKGNDLFSPLPDHCVDGDSLESLGLDPLLLPDLIPDLKKRFGGRDLSGSLTDLSEMHTVGDFLTALSTALGSGIAAPCMVYVDDEDANLFVFKRRFNKLFKVVYFTDPLAALDFILNDASVALVLTDEVMPNMTGNELCDRVHALKPALKFILLTGNPNNQDDLVYRTMRRNRFYEFLQKPLDFESRSAELEALFASLLREGGAT